jgi:hypothetical protein
VFFLRKNQKSLKDKCIESRKVRAKRGQNNLASTAFDGLLDFEGLKCWEKLFDHWSSAEGVRKAAAEANGRPK